MWKILTGLSVISLAGVMACQNGSPFVSGASQDAQASYGSNEGYNDGIEPKIIKGNPRCSDFGYKFEYECEVKIEDKELSKYRKNVFQLYKECGFDGKIFIKNFDGKFFDFKLEGAIAQAVLVKGGPSANLYKYFKVGGATMDQGLVSPLNPGGNVPDVSHITFCLDEAPKTAAIEINKTRCAEEEEGVPLAGVEFTITGEDGIPHVVTTDAFGRACVDDLPVGQDYTVEETGPLGGFEGVGAQTVGAAAVAAAAGSTCEGNGTVAPVSLDIENVPLTDVKVKILPQTDFTSGTITCLDEDNNVVEPDKIVDANGDLKHGYEGLPPGAYTCTIVIIEECNDVGTGDDDDDDHDDKDKYKPYY